MFGISLRLRADWFVFCSPFIRLVFVLWSKPSRRTVEAHPNQSRSCSLSLSSRCASMLEKTKDFYGLPWTFTDFFGLLAYTFFVIKHKIYSTLKKDQVIYGKNFYPQIRVLFDCRSGLLCPFLG